MGNGREVVYAIWSAVRSGMCLCAFSFVLMVIAGSFVLAGAPGKPSEILTATGTASSEVSAAGGNEIFHVAIFRFPKERINDAMTAFPAACSAARVGIRKYKLMISTGVWMTIREFYIVEHWASPAAEPAHERTEAFIHFGQGVLVEIRDASWHCDGAPF